MAEPAASSAATAQLSAALRGSRGFLVAPKRGRRAQPLLERPGRAESEAAKPEAPEAEADDGEWCKASSSSAPRLQPWRPRPRAAPGSAGMAAVVSQVPAWAQWPGTAAEKEDASDGEGEDWEPSSSPHCEPICIGFMDVSEEVEDEGTTCTGDEAEEDSDWEDQFAAAVIGFRAEVGPGHGFPLKDDSEIEEHVVVEPEAAEVTEPEAPDELMGDAEAIAFPLPMQGRVTHILFVVHGMGATPDALRKNAKDLKENFSAMQKYWFWHTDVDVHVEIIDWKSALSAEQSAIFDRITPAEARTTRMSLNATLSDVIFYKTAHHRAKIHEIVTRKMNSRFAALRADPAGRCDDARVSVVGHSLGSVIAYDVLSSFGRDTAPDLEFEVDNYFLWGSPLAAFISIADIEHASGKFTLPSRINTFNIFHPHDPVAFRLEPLYYHDQEQISPEMVPHWVNNGIEPSMQWVRSYEYAKVLAHRQWASLKSRLWEAVGSASQLDVCRAEWDSYVNSDADAPCMPAASSSEAAENTQETLIGPMMRIDYALQEHLVEGYVESYALLQSHFCYWTSHDVSLFMLKKLSQQDVARVSYLEKEQLERAQAGAVSAALTDGAAEAPESTAVSGTLSLLPTVLPDKADILRRLKAVPCIGRERLRDSPDGS